VCRSVKHYFLLDQGDFIVQFMDMADDEMKKAMEGINICSFLLLSDYRKNSNTIHTLI